MFHRALADTSPVKLLLKVLRNNFSSVTTSGCTRNRNPIFNHRY